MGGKCEARLFGVFWVWGFTVASLNLQPAEVSDCRFLLASATPTFFQDMDIYIYIYIYNEFIIRNPNHVGSLGSRLTLNS